MLRRDQAASARTGRRYAWQQTAGRLMTRWLARLAAPTLPPFFFILLLCYLTVILFIDAALRPPGYVAPARAPELTALIVALGVAFMLAPHPTARLRWRLLHFALVLGLVNAVLGLSHGHGYTLSAMLLLVAVFQAFFVLGQCGGYVAALLALLNILAYEPAQWAASGYTPRVMVISGLFFVGGLALTAGVSVLVLSERYWRTQVVRLQAELRAARQQAHSYELIAAELGEREVTAAEQVRALQSYQDMLARTLAQAQTHLCAASAELEEPTRAQHALGRAMELVQEARGIMPRAASATSSASTDNTNLPQMLAAFLAANQRASATDGPEFVFAVEGQPWPCPAAYERLCYDAVATELAAVHQWSGVRQIAVTLAYIREQVQLAIAADGVTPLEGSATVGPASAGNEDMVSLFMGDENVYSALAERAAALNGICRRIWKLNSCYELRICLPHLRYLLPADDNAVTLVRGAGGNEKPAADP
jgi:hypothetical protein